MKTTIKILLIILTFSISNGLFAQHDTIVKTNGEKIACTIIEVGTSGVSYKKADFPDGPAFVDSKQDIAKIIYRNGEIQTFEDFQNNSPNTTLNEKSNDNTQRTSSNGKGPISPDHKIIYDGKTFYVNERKVKQKDANRLLSRSNNPAVLVPLKTAKLTKTFSTISKITSFPSTIGGSIATISTVGNIISESRKDGVQLGSWVNLGLSVVGTLSLPITTKVLKKKSTKMYDKAIDIYNLDKK